MTRETRFFLLVLAGLLTLWLSAASCVQSAMADGNDPTLLPYPALVTYQDDSAWQDGPFGTRKRDVFLPDVVVNGSPSAAGQDLEVVDLGDGGPQVVLTVDVYLAARNEATDRDSFVASVRHFVAADTRATLEPTTLEPAAEPNR